MHEKRRCDRRQFALDLCIFKVRCALLDCDVIISASGMGDIDGVDVVVED